VNGPIVLACSGGLSSSAAVAWLAETSGADVVTVTLDLGQGHDLEEVRRRALAAGARRAHAIDARDEFARDEILPSIATGAFDDEGFPRIAALARPLVARTLAAIARIEGASAVAHASLDRAFDALLATAAPGLATLAPARAWQMGPGQVAEYVRSRRLPVRAAGVEVEQNLWGRMVALHAADEAAAPPEGVYRLTRAPADAPSSGAVLEIAFEDGLPASVSGVPMPPAQLVESLTVIAGRHGIGRMSRRARPGGGRGWTVYEAPAAVVLRAARAASRPTGVVRVQLCQGRHTLLPSAGDSSQVHVA
jgi:argininosuccinate synthase